jgi:hypothetical protein
MIEKIIFIINQAVNGKFTGSITLNFFQGNVTNVNKNESFKI